MLYQTRSMRLGDILTIARRSPTLQIHRRWGEAEHFVGSEAWRLSIEPKVRGLLAFTGGGALLLRSSLMPGACASGGRRVENNDTKP